MTPAEMRKAIEARIDGIKQAMLVNAYALATSDAGSVLKHTTLAAELDALEQSLKVQRYDYTGWVKTMV